MEYLQTWKVMESMVAAGKTKAIGVSNFTVEQLEQVRDAPNTATVTHPLMRIILLHGDVWLDAACVRVCRVCSCARTWTSARCPASPPSSLPSTK